MKGLSVAILVDGGFFLKRYGLIYPKTPAAIPQEVVEQLYTNCLKHLAKEDYLYRIFYYDCYPFEKKIQNPISKKTVDFSKTPQAKFRLEVFEELKRRRKVALRLGYVKENGYWLIKPAITKGILKDPSIVPTLVESDIFFEMRQKGIDIKIGCDIASLAYKRLVQKIILISGDADFVPAAKLARREGIDFILDPMWNNIDPQLFEHIDGLTSTCPKPVGFKTSIKTPLAQNTIVPTTILSSDIPPQTKTPI